MKNSVWALKLGQTGTQNFGSPTRVCVFCDQAQQELRAHKFTTNIYTAQTEWTSNSKAQRERL